MKSRFDHVTDDQIMLAIRMVKPPVSDGHSEYDAIDKNDDVARIAHLAYCMDWLKCWIGTPVTFFEHATAHWDGHRRVRALQFLSRRRDVQITFPVRYSTSKGV